MAERALARVNLAAVERNVALLCSRLSTGVELCAVVKADGYGHGAVPVAGAAVAGGATRLAVATAPEAAELRAGGITAPILIMGALTDDGLRLALEARAEVVAWSQSFVLRAQRALARAPSGESGCSVAVHVKLDTGMGRLGTREPGQALQVAAAVSAAPGLTLAGAMTHLATADSDLDFARTQLAAFRAWLTDLRRSHPGLPAHAANSAATLRLPESQHSFVRCGIAIYGLDPMNEDAAAHELEPALTLESHLAAVKPILSGQSTGYGRRYIAGRPSTIGILPLGYADGIRRAFSNNLEVLVGGSRYPLVGTVSMDNIAVDLGPATEHQVGRRAVLIGRDGQSAQSAEELARRIGTINYEITCGISARVPRWHHRDGVSE